MARAFEMAWTRAQLEFRYLGIGPAAAHRFQELASQLLYPNARLRPPADRLLRNRLGQSVLWAYGISGDLPMLVVTVAEARHLPLVREVLLAHAYWRLRGFQADLIILNQESPSYDQPLLQQLCGRSRRMHRKPGWIGRAAFSARLARDSRGAPESDPGAASIVLSGNRGSLQQQLSWRAKILCRPRFVPAGGGPERASRSRCRSSNCPISTGWADSRRMAANTRSI